MSQVDYQIKRLIIFPFSFYFKNPDSLCLHDPSPHVVGNGRIHRNPMLIFQNTFDPGQKTVYFLRERCRMEQLE
jgi:hypothetical protein